MRENGKGAEAVKPCNDAVRRRNYPYLLRERGTGLFLESEDTMVKYEADASINGLKCDRHADAGAVEAFANAIKLASGHIQKTRWLPR